jgi:hypothetical protein
MVTRRLSDAAILAQVPAARAREQAARRSGHRARTVRYARSAERVVIELSNGVLFAFPVAQVPALRRATPAQLAKVSLDAAGVSVRWELLDIDLSVAGLLLSAVAPAERRRALASEAGRVSSPAKASAARANGARGGRPRKVAV